VRDGDLYLLQGASETPSEVLRVEAATGKVKWKYALPRGAGRGLEVTGGHVTVVGGDATAYVLHADTGALVATVGLPNPLLMEIPAPLVVGRFVITVDRSGIACYSLDAAAHNMVAQKGRALGDPQISLLEARCQAALEHLEVRVRVVAGEFLLRLFRSQPLGKSRIHGAGGGLLLPCGSYREIIDVFVLGMTRMASNPGPLHVVPAGLGDQVLPELKILDWTGRAFPSAGFPVRSPEPHALHQVL